MLFKGWHRLFHDCIGREGPFLETICVPFAGLAILLWPLAVVGAVLGSMVSSIFLGAYAAVIVYQVKFPLNAQLTFFERNLIMFVISIFRRGLSGMDCVTLLLRFLFTTNTATISSTCPKGPAFLGSDICDLASFHNRLSNVQTNSFLFMGIRTDRVIQRNRRCLHRTLTRPLLFHGRVLSKRRPHERAL